MATPGRGKDHRPILVQAPVAPLDPDGVIVFVSGTTLFAIASVVFGFTAGDLASVGRSWWLWTSLAGTGLGLLGTTYCLARRRRRLRG